MCCILFELVLIVHASAASVRLLCSVELLASMLGVRHTCCLLSCTVCGGANNSCGGLQQWLFCACDACIVVVISQEGSHAQAPNGSCC